MTWKDMLWPPGLFALFSEQINELWCHAKHIFSFIHSHISYTYIAWAGCSKRKLVKYQERKARPQASYSIKRGKETPEQFFPNEFCKTFHNSFPQDYLLVNAPGLTHIHTPLKNINAQNMYLITLFQVLVFMHKHIHSLVSELREIYFHSSC